MEDLKNELSSMLNECNKILGKERRFEVWYKDIECIDPTFMVVVRAKSALHATDLVAQSGALPVRVVEL